MKNFLQTNGTVGKLMRIESSKYAMIIAVQNNSSNTTITTTKKNTYVCTKKARGSILKCINTLQ